MLPALSVAAIIGALGTGHRTLAHAKPYPAVQVGRGLAITALVLGYLSLALVLLMVVWLFGAALSGGLGE